MLEEMGDLPAPAVIIHHVAIVTASESAKSK
jgi:hypothetical protein